MPVRVASEAIEAARAAGPPPRATGAAGTFHDRRGTFHERQDVWLAVAMPGEVLPHEPAARTAAWKMCLKRHRNAKRAAAVREETLVDLRPADRPCVPDDSAARPDGAAKDWYVLPKDLIVSESWWTDACPAIEAVEAGAPQLTPNRTRAVRQIVAQRAAEGSESEGEEVVGEVHYTLGGEDRASARNRRRDKLRKREKACLKRMNDGARARRGLFVGGEGEGGAGGGGGEPRRPSLLGTAIPPPHVGIPAIGGGGVP